VGGVDAHLLVGRLRVETGRSVDANTSMTSAAGPFVIQFFEPSMTQCWPSFTATVSIVEASEPLDGSVSPKQPSFFPDASGERYSLFCASLPNFRIGSQTSELLTLMMTPHDAQAAEISSTASA
jgi:hypothetical protein